MAYYNRGLAWQAKGENDKAIADHTEALRLDPKFATAYIGRGYAWQAKGENDKAIADYTDALRLDPKDAAAYNNRGRAWEAKGENDKAIADYTEALRLDPKDAVAYNNRGNAWQAKGENDKAMADYTEALWFDPKYAMAYNNRGRLRATCPDAKYRDGKQAVADATKACELTGGEMEWNYFDTLAAAYAEAGDFDKAVEWQTKALDQAPENQRADCQSRLELYRSGKPYREEKK